MAKLYITFGQVHVHSVNGHTLDKNCVAVINGPNLEWCDKMAFEWMDGKFHQHTGTLPDMTYYPRGLIEINPEYKGDAGNERYEGEYDADFMDVDDLLEGGDAGEDND